MSLVGAGNLLAVRSGISQAKSKGAESKHVSQEKQMQQQHILCARDLIQRYSCNGTSKLGRLQVRALLSDLSKPFVVSEYELDYVFKIADANRDKAIGVTELHTLLNCWDSYSNSRDEIE